MKSLTITRPDDWHVHFRDQEFLSTTVPATAKQFARAMVMPNLKPPVTNAELAKTYRQRIKTAIPTTTQFEPLFALYLTEQTTAQEIEQAKKTDFIIAYKLYPAGATTHSAAGVADIEKIYPVLAALEQHQLVLSIHAETTRNDVDIFAREEYFLSKTLTPIMQRFPNLRIVVEHLSTAFGVEWVKAAGKNIAATITTHHLLLTRNDLLVGGIHPHYYCLPVVKTTTDRSALIAAATSGNPKFFLGTDSAPHAKSQKESACGCAGIFTSHAALELYASVFEQADALDKLEGFASFFGADFYQLPRNQNKITLIKKDWRAAEFLNYGEKEILIPFRHGEILNWAIKD